MSVTTINKKVCLLGDFAVGKTSLVRRFIYERFEDKYLSTIGVKVSRKTIVATQNGQIINLSIILWDLAGSEEFDQLRSSYLRGAAGAVLVCDLTRPDTLSHLSTYYEDLRQVSPAARVVLAANKADLNDQQRFSVAEVGTFADRFNMPFHLTSAKTGDQVESIFRKLGQLMLLPQ